MKTKTLYCSAIFVSSLWCSIFCFGQSNVVFYGANSNALTVIFVDTNLTQVAQMNIVSDLQVCLSEWGKTSQLYLRNKGESVGYLHNSKQCPHYPDTIAFPANVVSNGTTGFALQIPRSLSDAYTNAFAFATANSNIVDAACEFVAYVSSSNFVSLSSNALPNFVLQKNTTTNEIIADAHSIISELRHQTYYMPSILSFKNLEIGPSASNLWMLVPCSSPLSYSDIKEWSGYPAIWHEGKWKFCIWDNLGP